MSADELLFVYGTLRSDAGHPMREVLQAAATRLGPAEVAGTLLRVDWYPGLILDPAGGLVCGELWRVADREVWPRLDEYEGCSAADETPHEYARRHLRAQSRDLGPVLAWTYVYEGPTEGCEVIPSGDWLRRAHDRPR